jgi:hypothetical protein
MTQQVPRSKKGKFYPQDLTEDQLNAFGKDGQLVNTIIVKESSGDYVLIPLEIQYKSIICVDYLVI